MAGLTSNISMKKKVKGWKSCITQTLIKGKPEWLH